MYAVELIEPIIMMFWSFSQMFIFCNYGGYVNHGLEELSDKLYCCDWYCLPYDIRRMLPILMIATQKQVVRGSGDIPCSREAFSEVISTCQLSKSNITLLLRFDFVSFGTFIT